MAEKAWSTQVGDREAGYEVHESVEEREAPETPGIQGQRGM